ncbi:DUF418 domain-containing protein [Lysinibacillus cavernae]|uniref:DUF418 domain-containing protein n=1 Tax=Lysinibacillus cavernae TaxID=2666135 RepID=UPI0012D99716|nr:DUF418 domain-containing protein [Lysinibacillus cavernae]
MNSQKEQSFRQNRIYELDIIRGFALIGIFLVNIFNFIQRAGIDSTLLPTGNWIDILVTGKFYAIFSLLFGAGAAIFIKRANHNGKPSLLFIRRMVVLAVIGLLHAQVWGGDVLLPYALVGLVLFALHKIPSKALFIITFSLHMIGILVNVSAYDWLYGGKTNMPPTLDALLLITALTSFLVYFIEGFTLMKMDALSKLQTRPPLHKWLLIVFGSISVISVTAQFMITDHKPAHILLIISQLPLMLTYILLILLLLKNKNGRAILYPLQAYGRMAMSNYLGQTVVGIFILPMFIHHFSPSIIIYGLCIFTWVIQIIMSNVWLKFFNYGPVEWVWRCFTYWHIVQLRKLN